MLISCPKCSSVFNVINNRIPFEGKKFKCSECGHIWTVYPKDLKELEVENQIKSQIIRPAAALEETQDDINAMFDRLSEDTKGLFSNYKADRGGFLERIMRKIHVFFTPVMLSCSILFVIFCFTLYIGYHNRYEIVGFIPKLEDFYNKLELESIYAGRDVKFQNVKITDLEKSGKHYVEVTGVIHNEGKFSSQILPIKATMTNLSGEVEAETSHFLTLKRLGPDFSAMFRILLDNKTTVAKKITLTFDTEIIARMKREAEEAEKARKEAEEAKKAKGSSFMFGLNKGMDKF
ncbi:MAG: zinc-ribbon domain-containing protein [Alphaproteobacteria bacterium]|nr:zinc-ribbon domain-containing protein [Alphaproteobacteria bacterium]